MTEGEPNLREALSNWRESRLPLASKLRLLVSNNYRKLRRLDSCCGNPGEPGC